MNVETKRNEVDAAMAEIEKNIAGTFEAPTQRLHERPKFSTSPSGAGLPHLVENKAAIVPQTLPAMLAELLAVVEAGDELLGRRLARIEAFLGIEGEP